MLIIRCDVAGCEEQEQIREAESHGLHAGGLPEGWKRIMWVEKMSAAEVIKMRRKLGPSMMDPGFFGESGIGSDASAKRPRSNIICSKHPLPEMKSREDDDSGDGDGDEDLLDG